jgi:hypothetical protein
MPANPSPTNLPPSWDFLGESRVLLQATVWATVVRCRPKGDRLGRSVWRPLTIVVRMVFWSTQLGPLEGGDTRRPGERCIGEVVCPECENALARLYDAPGGVSVDCWVPGHGASPADPGGKSVGWRFSTFIDANKAEAASALACWRGHHGFEISTKLCREIEAAYRISGRKTRRPAIWLEESSGGG